MAILTNPEDPTARYTRLIGMAPPEPVAKLLREIPEKLPKLHALLLYAPTDAEFAASMDLVLQEMLDYMRAARH